MNKINKIIDEGMGGYLFNDGKWIDFEIIKANNINFKRETGALRIRVTSKEVNIDFLKEKIPTQEQLKKIEELLPNKKLVFEIVDKNNQSIGIRGFDTTINEMIKQLKNFYKK